MRRKKKERKGKKGVTKKWIGGRLTNRKRYEKYVKKCEKRPEGLKQRKEVQRKEGKRKEEEEEGEKEKKEKEKRLK